MPAASDDMDVDAEGVQRDHGDGRSTKALSEERSKRRRLDQIGQLCNKTLLKQMLEQLHEKATKPVQRDVKRTERQNWGASKVDVTEIYSPPRMTSMADSLSQTPGSATDLTTVDAEGVP